MEDKAHKKREYNKKIYYACKERGMCTKCMKLKAEPGHTLCLICRMDARGKPRILTPEQKERRSERQKQWTQQHKEQGLCVSCNKPVYKNHVRCYEHHIYHARRQKQIHRSKGYGDAGLCRICGKEPAAGKKLCPEHSSQYAERITKRNKERANGTRRD